MKSFKKNMLLLAIALVVVIWGTVQLTEPVYAYNVCTTGSLCPNGPGTGSCGPLPWPSSPKCINSDNNTDPNPCYDLGQIITIYEYCCGAC